MNDHTMAYTILKDKLFLNDPKSLYSHWKTLPHTCSLLWVFAFTHLGAKAVSPLHHQPPSIVFALQSLVPFPPKAFFDISHQN